MPRFHISYTCVCVCVWGGGGGGGGSEKALCFSWLKVLFLFFFWGDFGQELFCKECHAVVISRTKGEHWNATYFRMRVGTRCSEYSEWIFSKAKTLRELLQFLSLISREPLKVTEWKLHGNCRWIMCILKMGDNTSALHPTFSVSKYWYGVTPQLSQGNNFTQCGWQFLPTR